MKKNKIMKLILACLFVVISFLALANTEDKKKNEKPTHTNSVQTTTDAPMNVVEERAQQEKAVINNPFLISFYQPTYILPFYFSQSPDRQVYENNTPNNEGLNNYEVKYQFSFKAPVWYDMFHSHSSIYLAYTQLSYWQAYNQTAFFRETDYSPEVFVANKINFPLGNGWEMNFLNFGLVHQSNGKGGDLERSWNRAYAEGIISRGNWFLSVKPWLVFDDSQLNRYNPDIAKYLGYERTVLGYKYGRQVFSLETQNTIESGFSRGALTLGWSFPLTTHFKGYIQVFSGYGQSLIEYNHYTNAIGIGVSLNDWI